MKRLLLPIFSMFLLVPSFVFAQTAETKILQLRGSIAASDLGRDGIAEIVIGSEFGNPPEIKILRQDGSRITAFNAYDKNFTKGIHVAVGDIDGDGMNDIITAPSYGGGPHIRIFDGTGKLKSEFFAYNQNFRGGTFVTTRDLDGDGKAEIITGAGPSGGPHVRIFDSAGKIKSEFFAFDSTDVSGVTLGTADLDQDGKPEILVGRASSDPPQVKIFTPQGRELGLLTAFDPSFTGGVTPIGFDWDGDGRDDIVVAPNGRSSTIKIFKYNGEQIESVTPFEADFNGSIQLAPIQNSSGSRVLFAAKNRSYREGNIAYPKSIVVDLSEQRLYAYEYGVLTESFLVSTGVKKYPTPTGDFSVQAKIPKMDYVWSYGPRHPDNYDIKDVPWNLRFAPHLYIHNAYWHNNFGHVMSHGCINMALATSKWVYDWASVGTPVTIRE